MRKVGTLAASAIFMTAVAAAESGSGSYLIELSDGTRVMALDAPVRRGTVVTFHASGGTLTGVPAEMVVRILNERDGRASSAVSKRRPVVGTRPDVMTVRPQAGPLEPGDVLVLGPMGDGIAASATGGAVSGGANASTAGTGTGVGGGYGGALDPNVVNPGVVINPNQTLVGTDGLARVPSTTDLARAQAAQTPVGPNGFPATNGAPTVIGPNGTPTLAPGVPGSGTPVIGPNGTPVLSGVPPTVIGPNGTPVTATGSPVSAQPVIGPNGTPVAPNGGQPGSAQPVIGPNGTPVLAQPGQPGSAQPVIGPNGTPVLAPQGQPGGPAPGAAPSGGGATGAPSGSGSGSGPGMR